MKKTLATLFMFATSVALADTQPATAAFATGDDVYVVFTSNSGYGATTLTSSEVTGTKTYNGLSTSDSNGGTYSTIFNSNGVQVLGLSFYASSNASGVNGGVSTFSGTTTAISEVFDTSLISRVINSGGNSGSYITFSGLDQGSYTLTALVGRGNAYASSAGITTYTLTATADGTNSLGSLTSSVVAYNTNKDTNPSVGADGVITGYSSPGGSSLTANNWILMTYTFEVTADNSEIKLTGTGSEGNFAALKLHAVSIPEPATATLSLLALAGLATRRRRK